MATTNYADLINQAYANIGRTGIGDAPNQIDQGGYDYWLRQLESGLIKPDQFGQTFNDTVANYFTQYDNADPYKSYITDNLVNSAYGDIGRTGIGTDPNQIDQGGYDYWTQQLNSGALRPDQFNQAFSDTVLNYLTEQPNNPVTQQVMQSLNITNPSQATGAVTGALGTSPPAGSPGAPGTPGEGYSANPWSPTAQFNAPGYLNDAAGAISGMLPGMQGVVGNLQSQAGAVNMNPAINQLMSGQVNTQYLDQVAANMMADATRNLRENVFTGIDDAASRSGQFGSSRNAMALGLAASRMNQDLATPIAAMYAGANENAQNRIGTGINAGLGLNTAANNAAITQGNLAGQLGQIGTAGGQLQNQTMATALPYLAAPQNAAMQAYGTIGQMGQNLYGNQWNALGNYANTANPLLPYTGSQSSSQNYYVNPWAAGLGGLATGVGVGNVLTNTFPNLLG